MDNGDLEPSAWSPGQVSGDQVLLPCGRVARRPWPWSVGPAAKHPVLTASCYCAHAGWLAAVLPCSAAAAMPQRHHPHVSDRPTSCSQLRTLLTFRIRQLVAGMMLSVCPLSRPQALHCLSSLWRWMALMGRFCRQVVAQMPSSFPPPSRHIWLLMSSRISSTPSDGPCSSPLSRPLLG